MILKKLIIHNIASIEHAEIDFLGSVLLNEPLFLITGETGSGKTTILDAICLCLYKQTPRMNGKSKETICGFTTYKDKDGNSSSVTVTDVRLLLRRNTALGYTSLEFEDNNHKNYIAKWEVTKSYGKTDGNLQKASWELVNLTDNYTLIKDAEIESEILKCVGMNFAQFCRTCMLSQGEFTRFLKSDEKEKGEILEKLTQTEIYSRIGKNIYQISKHKEQELEKKNIELEAVKLLSDEQLAQIKSIIEQDNLLNTQKTEELLLLTKKIDYFTKLSSLQNDLQSKENQLNENKNYLNSEENKAKIQIINLWNETIHLRGQIEDKNRYVRLLKTQTDKSKAYKDRFLSLNGGLKYHINLLSNVKQQHKNINEEIENKQEEINLLQEKYSSFNLNDLTQQYKYFIKQKEDLVTLRSSISLYNQNKIPFDNTLKRLESNIVALKENEQQLENNKQQISDTKQKYKIVKNQYDKIASSLDDWAKMTRLKLTKGDKCPLCGQVIDEVFDDKEFEKIVAPLQKEVNEIETKLYEIEQYRNKIEVNISHLTKEQNDLRSQESQFRKQLCEIKKQIEEKCKLFGLNLILDSDSIELVSLIDSIGKSIENVSNQMEQVNQLGIELNKLQSQKSNILLIKQQIEDEENLINSCLQAKKTLEDFTEKWEKEDVLLQNVDNLMNHWYSLREDFLIWKNQIGTLRDNINNCDKNIEIFLQQNPAIRLENIDILKNYNQQSINEFQVCQEKLLSQIHQLQGALDHINKEIENIKNIDFQIEKSDNPNDLKQIKYEIEKEIQQIQQRLGANKKTLENNEKNIVLFEKKLKEKEVFARDCEKWATLCKIFGSSDGKQFRKIAQSFILNDLLNKSNYYLRRFSDRFELCSQENTLSIFIKDKFEGSLVAPAANLSGGEGFMVSLSLALGLSEMSTRNAFCDILFIDEGFGTLSGEYLNVVMEVLEKLHQIGGRRVGIISHVTDLKERISAQIRVKRKNNTTSTIEIVRN